MPASKRPLIVSSPFYRKRHACLYLTKRRAKHENLRVSSVVFSCRLRCIQCVCPFCPHQHVETQARSDNDDGHGPGTYILHDKNFDNRARILQKLRIFRLMCLEVQSAAGYLLNGGAGDGQLVTLRDEVHTCTYALYSMHTPGCVHLIS